MWCTWIISFSNLEFCHVCSFVFYDSSVVEFSFQCKTILPEPKQYIVGVCNEKNKVSECVYKNDRDYFYIVRIGAKDDYMSKVIEVRCQSTFASRIKSSLLGGDSSILDVRSISDFDHFVEDGYCYIVVYERPSLPVLDIKIVDKC